MKEEMQDILFDTGRNATTNKPSEENYDYPQFPPTLTQSMSRVTSAQAPKVSTKRFPALPQKPTTRGRIKTLVMLLAQGGRER
jgi:hypothetical protein